jgi:hypothetical protein
MSQETEARLRAAILFIAPLALLIGFAYHPYVGNIIDSSEVADTINDDPDRWALATVIIAVALGALVVALTALRHELRSRADERWSVYAVPLSIFGAATFAAALGTDITAAAVANSGGDVVAVLDAVEPWTNAIYGIGGIAFSLGLLGLAIATYRGKALGSSQLDLVVAIAFLVVAVGNLVPQSIAEYVIVVALCVAMWPFAYRAWGETSMQAAPAPGMVGT